MSSGFLKFARTVLFVLLILAPAGGAVGIAWYTAERSTASQRAEAIQRANTAVTGLAADYGEQINRHILALDQTLDNMVREWEADPRRFNLETSRARARILTGISRDMFLADENGIIRQASVPDFLGQSAGDLDVFRDAAEHTNDPAKLYLGGASVNPIMRQWHLDAARTLHHPDGSFAGIIDADYRLSAINDVFAAVNPVGNGFAGLISLTDGKLRTSHGATMMTPDASIADTPMFAAVDAAESGLWVGPSATDAVVRIHAFRRIAGSDLAVVTGIDQNEALQPVANWRFQSRLFAGAITGLILAISVMLLNALRKSRHRAALTSDSRAQLAAAHALAEVSRARADAVARRLQATFAAVTDGVAIFDAHLNLVEWNALFPEHSGVNATFIRTGMPMEDVLRTQARSGYFGDVTDVEAEVERRAILLRAGNFGASQAFRAEDRTIELRCRPLAEGGFVALYTDVTEARRARQALRESRDTLRHEQTARARFLGVVAFELRARVAMLMRSISRPRTPEDVPTYKGIRAAGEMLAALATDTVEIPLMEAGTLTLQPEMIAIPALLRDVIEAIQPAARDRGITVYLVVKETTPAELLADSGRIRKIVTSLLCEAIRSAAPDTMWLLADGGEDEPETALRLTIRGFGSPMPEGSQAGMFPSLAAVATPDQLDDTAPYATTTGLGLAIARHLTTLMGGDLRGEGWSTMDGRTGNDIILTLPPDLLPGQRGRAPGQVPAEGKPLPRTKVLMIGPATGLRMAEVTMLRRDSHMVDTVATAEEAIPLLESAPYDVVFMDTDLTGATVEQAIDTIRDMTGPARTIPVILLAPPTEEQDRRGWLGAGATDILTSSPTLEELSDAIGRNVWQSGSIGPGLGFMPGLEGETEEGFPILAADRIAELQANIPQDDLLDMVEECIADLFHRLPVLRRSLASGAPGTITAHAHAMMGMAGGYGMAVLEARLRAILTAVRGRRLDTIDGAADVVESDLTRAAAALRRVLRIAQPAKSGAQT